MKVGKSYFCRVLTALIVVSFCITFIAEIVEFPLWLTFGLQAWAGWVMGE